MIQRGGRSAALHFAPSGNRQRGHRHIDGVHFAEPLLVLSGGTGMEDDMVDVHTGRVGRDTRGVGMQQMQVFTVVDAFGAIGQRSAHERHLAGVLAHERIRGDHVDGHREIEIDDVAVMPCAGQIQVAILDSAGDVGTTAHGDRIGGGFAAGPSRQTEGDREGRVLGFPGFLGFGSFGGFAGNMDRTEIHRDGPLAGPRHIAIDVEIHIGTGKPGMNRASHIQMHVQRGRVVADRVGVLLHVLHDARDVRRAAGAAEPLLAHRLDVRLAFVAMAGFGHHFKRIHVEEAFAVERHAGERGVVQRRFHDVRVFGFRLDLEHAAREEGERDGRAAFRVGGVVRQIVVKGEGLSHVGCADAAGDVELSVDDVAPQSFAGCQQVGVAGQSCHVGGSGVEVGGADGVAERFLLFRDRLVGLIVGVVLLAWLVVAAVLLSTTAVFKLEVERLLAALAHEVFGEVGVALFAGGFGQFDECHFGDFVAGIAMQLAIVEAESGIDVIGETAGRVEQLALAGGLVVGNRAFGQVAEAVQFMMVLQVGEVPVHAVEDVVGVEVAVVELRRADDVDGGVGGRLEFGVRMMGQRVADRFDPFGEVGVLEHEAVELVGVGVLGIIRKRLKTAERVFRRHEGLAFLAVFGVLRGGGLEVVHAVAGSGAGNVVVQRVPLVGNHLGAHEFLA